MTCSRLNQLPVSIVKGNSAGQYHRHEGCYLLDRMARAMVSEKVAVR